MNLFGIKKEVTEIKDIVLRSINNMLEYKKEEENYYKPVRVNYTEHESDGDKNNNLSLDEYLNEIKPYLKDIIIDLQKILKKRVKCTQIVAI